MFSYSLLGIVLWTALLVPSYAWGNLERYVFLLGGWQTASFDLVEEDTAIAPDPSADGGSVHLGLGFNVASSPKSKPGNRALMGLELEGGYVFSDEKVGRVVSRGGDDVAQTTRYRYGYDAAVMGRAGAELGPLMIYAKGGYGWVQLENTGRLGGKDDALIHGPRFGGGIEFDLAGTALFMRVDYSYVSFDKGGRFATTQAVIDSGKAHMIRVGVTQPF
ncbi:MAG: outer membrane beta-barrel protein [Alphaproteobacteria bacterium GM7ARS4]|nr:outer membrane beta-barrel protein [Alphaproteobacteria bacterium GM7ARS4]